MTAINPQRLWQYLMEMATIGATEKGGNTRLALSAEDSQGRAQLIAWGEQIGLSPKRDAIGNLFLCKKGKRDDWAPIVLGSHLDTQPKGGRFDGIYGVLAGLEVLQSLHEKGIETEHPLELAVWCNEEGARFTPAMMGSAVFCQSLSLAEALQAKDKQGISVAEALASQKEAGDTPLARPMSAYLELHIEQGPILEANNIPIGVVTGGQGIIWLDAITSGQAAHAGTTPMNMRHDSMVATARMMSELEASIKSKFPQGLVTFGELQVAHSSRNTIPARIHWSIDLRHPNEEMLQQMHLHCADLLQNIAKERGVSLQLQKHWYSPPTLFAPALIECVRLATEKAQLPHQDIISGAGHDAIHLALHCPSTMIFIPCENGLSHNEAENITAEQAAQGCEVLYHTLCLADQLRNT